MYVPGVILCTARIKQKKSKDKAMNKKILKISAIMELPF